MLLSISSARHTTCCSCFQAAYLWSASHQVRRARVLGQSWRLFLGKDWDLSASVLTLQKNLKNKKCIALILEMLLFWLISATWVYRGRIIGSEAGGQAGRDAHISLIFSNAQDYDQVPKKLHSEWGGGWLMCCSSNELPFCLPGIWAGRSWGVVVPYALALTALSLKDYVQFCSSLPSNAAGMPQNWRVEGGWEAGVYGVQEVSGAWRGEQPTLLGGTVKNCEPMPAS